MFATGTDSSSTTTGWVMAELMQNPKVLAKVQEQVREAMKGKNTVDECDPLGLEHLKMVIKETLRLHPPVALLPRSCREECIIDRYTIPEKSKVLINEQSIGRDPNYWDEPKAFKPKQFENSSVDFLGSGFKFLPFGSGRRM